MAETIQLVEYFYIEAPDKPGEAACALAQLKEAGFLVHIPEGLADFGGAKRLRAKVRLGARNVVDSSPLAQAGLEGSVSADWSLMLGDDTLSMEDFAQMASLKHPLVAWKGKWVALDPTFDEAPADAAHIKLNDGVLDEAGRYNLMLDILQYFDKISLEITRLEGKG